MSSARSGPAPQRIAVLHHKDHPQGSQVHLISFLSEAWRKQGIQVFDLHGTDEFVRADILVMHVDRTIVPPAYAAFARRYPCVVNASAVDISKHRYADGLLKRTSDYPGPVIVKSDLNYGGAPEMIERYHSRPAPVRAISRVARLFRDPTAKPIRCKEDYRIYDTLSDVPGGYFHKDYVVQKFRPERENGRFVLREYYFMGERHYQSMEMSDSAVFTDDIPAGIVEWTPPAELIALRRKLGLEYGKIDFVMADGKPFVFDANKTMGLGHVLQDAHDMTLCRARNPAYCAMADGLAAGLVEWYAAKALEPC